jgi:hypothetical protein
LGSLSLYRLKPLENRLRLALTGAQPGATLERWA